MSIFAWARTVSGILGWTDVDAADDFLAWPDLGHDLLHVLGREPVDDGAVGLPSGEAQHARPQGRHEDRRNDRRRPLQAEPPHREGVVLAIDLLAREGLLEEARPCHGCACRALRRRCPFQRSTITSDEVPSPNTKRPGAASAIVATHIASVAGPRVNDGTMAVPSAERRRPRRRHRQRDESVRAARLGRPHVGVAEVDQFLDDLPVLGERSAVEGNGDAVRGHRRILRRSAGRFGRLATRPLPSVP